LPKSTNSLRMEGLRIGESSVSVLLTRGPQRINVETTGKVGEVAVHVRQDLAESTI
jgi:hypothetical protein